MLRSRLHERIELFKKYDKYIKQPYLYFIKYYLSKLLNIYPITLNFKNGLKYKIYSVADHFHCQEYINNYYDIKNIEHKNIVLDIGANSGDFSIFISQKATQVFAFEPIPLLFNRIKENAKINNFKNIHIFNYAIAERSGQITFNPEDNVFCARAVNNGKLKVSAVTWNELYKLIGRPACIDLLKMDCEGGEYTLIKSNKILDVVKDLRIELHIYCESDKSSAKRLIEILKKYKFKPKNLTYNKILSNIDSSTAFYCIEIHLQKE